MGVGREALFDDLFAQRSQREAFRRSLEGLLLPAERRKTLTGLANTAPVAGAQHPRAQGVPWFLSESTWAPATRNARRLALLRADPATAPDARGVLGSDEHGDRKWGRQTAPVGRQDLANLGKTDNGVVAVTSLWADARAYYPLDDEPYTPARHVAGGTGDPAFRTKLQIARELVTAAVEAGVPFRAVGADRCYGEGAGFRERLHELRVGYVLALTPSPGWWHREGTIGALWAAARAAGWRDADAPGSWVEVVRACRDGHTETWWALEVVAGPYGAAPQQRAVVATTDPATLPERQTWYLATNLPRPGMAAAEAGAPPPADLAEVVRLYGLRRWVEQSDKQTKYALGWSQ
ncbi:MAG TPA: transposase [Thermomicrobiales bacterium]|nr:transposase [Thermomicrobiales bacterium]